MCNSLLKPLIQKFKKQDMAVFPLVYDEFKNLIAFYAKKLCYEDAAADLNLFFIELLYAIDLSNFKADESIGIRRYIAVCLRNEYIVLSVKAEKLKSFSFPLFETFNSYSDDYDDKILLSQAFKALSEKQKAILIDRYYYGYSIAEISKKMGVTRQTINDTKIRALCSLKKILGEKYNV